MKRKQRVISVLLITMLVLLAVLSGCGTQKGGMSGGSASSGTQASSAAQSVDREAEASALLDKLSGSYEELWPVMLESKYDDIWTEACTKIVGKDKAENAVEKLKAACTGTLIGQKAVDTYGKEGGPFNCAFTGDVEQFTFSGNTISGVDKKGKAVFTHTYHYVGYDKDSGFYEFVSDDKDSGQFTYFVLAPDTPATTYHIEFRYGSDLKDLVEFQTGKYAYWMAAGVTIGSHDSLAKSAIGLFCTENLTE